MLHELNDEYMKFQQCLLDADVMLKKHKEKFKSGLLTQAEEFRKHVGGLFSDFFQQGPFTSAFTSEKALEVIGTFK